VRYDRRGFSRSGATVPSGVEQHADDAIALIEALAVAPCLLVGSSSGAVAAVEVARRRPDLLRGLVLCEPPLFSLDPAVGAALRGELLPRLEAAAADGPRAAVDAFASFVFPEAWALFDEDRRNRLRENAESGFVDVQKPSADIGVDDLRAVTVPALVVAGRASHPAFHAISDRLVAGLPDARVVELDCGHVPSVERPAAFADVLSTFACELDRRAGATPEAGQQPPVVTGGSSARAVRVDVASADGTPLAVWVRGHGRPIVLVHGSPTDHGTFDPLVDELVGDFTTFALDRRGSGASGDVAPYAIEREFEDVVAVVDAVAARTGEPVTLWGHSYGCNPAMGAAALTDNVHRLVLYEPSFGLPYPDGAIAALEREVDAGHLAAAVRIALVGTGAMTDDELAALQAGPRWPSELAAVPTLARECRVEDSWVYPPGRFAAIRAATRLLTGSETDATIALLTERAAAAIPGAEILVLEGHGHFAHRTDPALVGGVIRDFVSS
jgi:pimeloyl-ACP methyl ester carboxylesterase